MTERFDIDSIDRAEVLRYLGHHGQELSDDLDDRLDAAMAACLAQARPSGAWRVFDVDDAASVPGRLCLVGTTLGLEGADIAHHLEGACAVGVMAVTLGAGVDQELRRLSLTDALGQVLLDACATTLVERAADACEARLVAEADRRGLFLNARYSPGYGDLPLDAQRPLLACLDAGRGLGLTLTASSLLVPTKSVTAVCGLFTAPRTRELCLCDKCHCHDFCTIRPTGRTCRG
ncbi:MAG: vitamin B12 dependent-methionine synthase activation domain-containing protein [Atopobiaceae bacterium]|nr:hypothetical protein [Atopobiaceae bacterium]MCH4181128.1 hypothetical protein [Atopobiaceae bacterium]MCH4215027.1 hypothetical protein [Atopobiaceae bacterium]MCH4229864.1 hypothetical protein [Atopobiaceae bacterium]MCH4277009.1 hypothetical protein [Atopobiaceae bacterium]